MSAPDTNAPATRISGTLVFFVPVVFESDPDDPRTPEEQYIAWAKQQYVVSPHGGTMTPGVTDDPERAAEDVTVRADGIEIGSQELIEDVPADEEPAGE